VTSAISRAAETAAAAAVASLCGLNRWLCG
jgi:hypothetical protein